MKPIKLNPNEGLLLQEDVGRENDDPGLARALLDLLEDGTLILTNKRIIFAKPKGMLQSSYELTSFPLEEIKIINGVAQVRPAKSERHDSSYQITLYLRDHQEIFHFPLKTPMSNLKRWVHEINRACTGIAQGWHPEDIGLIDVQKAFSGLKKNVSKTLEVAKATTDNIGEAAIPAAKTAFEAAKPLIPVAAAAASVIPSPAGKLAGAVLGAINTAAQQDHDREEQSDNDGDPNASDHKEQPVSTNANTLDEQIEKVKKLKELLDCGILTQEEFETKKRELLGL